MAIRYEIKQEETEIVVYFYNEEIQPEPTIRQPFWPLGEPFASIEDATIWAEAKLNEYDPNCEWMAGNHRDEPVVKKLTENEKAIIRLEQSLGMPIDEAKKLLGLL